MKTQRATVGAFEAKNRFSELLKRVGRGAEITITKRNQPVARLLPVSGPSSSNRTKAVAELRALRKQYSLKGQSMRELIDEGRR